MSAASQVAAEFLASFSSRWPSARPALCSRVPCLLQQSLEILWQPFRVAVRSIGVGRPCDG